MFATRSLFVVQDHFVASFAVFLSCEVSYPAYNLLYGSIDDSGRVSKIPNPN
jgi:hypothetical protein